VIGVKKPLTDLGKFLVHRATDNNWTRAELAAKLGVSEGLLAKLLHGHGYKLVSVQKVIQMFGDEISEEMANTFLSYAKESTTRHVFEAVPGSPRDRFLASLSEDPGIVDALAAWDQWEMLKQAAVDSNMDKVALALLAEIRERDPAAEPGDEYIYTTEALVELERRSMAGEPLTAHEQAVLDRYQHLQSQPGSMKTVEFVEPTQL